MPRQLLALTPTSAAICSAAVTLAVILLRPFDTSARDQPPVSAPGPRGQTDAVPHGGDAADDPAVWVHPDDAAKSLVLGTDKRGGLHVYDLDGRDLQTVGDGDLPNNVDVAYGFPLGGGRPTDLAVATTRSHGRLGVVVWAIDPAARRLADVTAGRVLPVVAGGDPYGVCTYHSPKTGDAYFFVSDTGGRVEQYRLVARGGGAGGDEVSAERVRALKFSSVVEGCVADDEAGVVYLAEEKVGIWRYGAEPDAGAGAKDGKLIARVGENGLTADVEGLTLYAPSGDGKGKLPGYLIASSQGSNDFKVYERGGDNRFVLTLDPVAGTDGKGGRIDDVSDTDGIAVTHRPLGRRYPKGVLVVQDGSTPGGRQNFKLYGWEDVAGDRLIVDPAPTTRPAGPGGGGAVPGP